MAGLKNMTHLRFDKRILVLGVIVSMIIPFQAASGAVTPGIYGINFEEATFYQIDANLGEFLDEQILQSIEFLPGSGEFYSDFGGAAMAIHSDGTFFASIILEADDPQPPERVLVTINADPADPNYLLVTPIGLDFIKDVNDNILPIDGLAFDSSNTLYGVTDTGTLYTIPLVPDGSGLIIATKICDLPITTGVGYAISFDNDVLHYIFTDLSGNVIFQTVNISTDPCTIIQNLSLSPPISNEQFISLTNTGNVFLGTTVDGFLISITKSGMTFIKNPNETFPQIGGLAKFGPNQPPVADDDSLSIEEDEPELITLTGSDPDGDTLTFTVTSGPSSGSLDTNTPPTNADGVSADVLYTSVLNYNGPDSFTFKVNDGTVDSDDATITITINEVDDPPIAVNDEYTVEKGGVLDVSAPGVLGNDSDPEGDPFTAVLDSGPTEGTLLEPPPSGLDPNGSFTYTPDPDFVGSDSFTYHGDDGTVPTGNIATVTIIVTDVDPGVFVEPEFQENLTDKMIKQFKKKIYNWEHRIDKLEYKIIKLDAKIAKAVANGNLERAAWLEAKKADKQDKIEILEDFISITKVSIGTIPEELVPVELQENLLPKSVEKIEHKIIKWIHKIANLNHRADNLEEKAEHYSDKGKDAKAKKLLAKAYALRDKAEVFEDLNEVLIVAIDFDTSDVKLHDKYDHKDKGDKEDHSWSN